MAKKPTKKPVKAAKSAAKKPAPKKAAPKKAIKPDVKKISAKQPTKTTNNNVKKMPEAKKQPEVKTEKKTNKIIGKVTLPPNYKPSDKEEYMNSNQLQYFREKLLAWKLELSTELSETLDNLKEENWQESDITDRATVETDASLELRTRDRYRKLINKINAALQRIDKGDYGYCEETGEEIGIKRLMARPIATLTVEAQERHERDERTHYDEDMEERLA